MRIGHYDLPGLAILAPMAGVTDVPYRRICLRHGASLAVGEMVASSEHLRGTQMSVRRFACDPTDPHPVVQLLGADPVAMASAAEHAQSCGAAIVDINFGCPARVVCGKACGSAIMQNEALAQRIMHEVVSAVTVPVTVKMRTGWSEQGMNAVTIAKMAQDTGLSAVTVHGRTRAQRFTGAADYAAIAKVVQAVQIPVIANGDIDTPLKAMSVLRETGAAGVMIGRAAYGNPWIFERLQEVLSGCPDPGEPSDTQVLQTLLAHMHEHFDYWGESLGSVRMMRKHVRWYLSRVSGSDELVAGLMQMEVPSALVSALEHEMKKRI